MAGDGQEGGCQDGNEEEMTVVNIATPGLARGDKPQPMKRINIAYWIITGLFSAFMIFSSIGGVTLDENAVAYLHDHLGYPLYFIQIISVAKILGAIAIVLPMVPTRVKEHGANAREGMGLLRILHRPHHGRVLVHRRRRPRGAMGADVPLHRGSHSCLLAPPQASLPSLRHNHLNNNNCAHAPLHPQSASLPASSSC